MSRAPTTLDAGEVHVYRCSLDRHPDRAEALRAALSEDERERAARFRFERERRRFVVGRSVLRAILSRYLGTDPAGLRLGVGPNGKPYLLHGARGGRPGLDFNVTHSGGFALFAVSRSGPVGLDVERVRELSDLPSLVRSCFGPREATSILRLDGPARTRAFFRCWTLKEALAKATGWGIPEGLSGFEVDVVPAAPLRLRSCAAGGGRPADWCVREIEPGAGYVGALAVRGCVSVVRLGTWPRGRGGPDGVADPPRSAGHVCGAYGSGEYGLAFPRAHSSRR